MSEALKELQNYELVIRQRLAEAVERHTLAVELDFPEEAQVYAKAIARAERDLAQHQEFMKPYGLVS